MNLANQRREFFRVTLEEIREAVEKNFGVVTFVTVPQAEEFHRSQAMREDLKNREGGGTALPVATRA